MATITHCELTQLLIFSLGTVSSNIPSTYALSSFALSEYVHASWCPKDVGKAITRDFRTQDDPTVRSLHEGIPLRRCQFADDFTTEMRFHDLESCVLRTEPQRRLIRVKSTGITVFEEIQNH